MNGHLRLGPGREFDAVRALMGVWGDWAVGIGDDAALLDVPSGSRLVVSTDSTVEGIHFRREWLEPEEIGWRATMAALSDLAAMTFSCPQAGLNAAAREAAAVASQIYSAALRCAGRAQTPCRANCHIPTPPARDTCARQTIASAVYIYMSHET